MKHIPSPLTQPPQPHSFWQDFWLLAQTELRLSRNKMRQWPVKVWLLIAIPAVSAIGLLVWLASMAYGALGSMTPDLGQGFLSLIFMAGVLSSMFFGVTSAFATLYMSGDLELLFVAPVATRAVFAIKTLKIAFSNLFGIAFFVFLPGLFFGLLLKAGPGFYLWLIVVTLALLALGTALAELLNLVVMRLVPPHRSKEAVGFIGALSGILIALLFQIPNLVMSSGTQFDLGAWLANQHLLLQAMNWFPWGWGAQALTQSAQGQNLAALAWSLPTILLALAVFLPAFLLVERGFRRGWISLSQGSGGKKVKARKTAPVPSPTSESAVLAWDASLALAPPRLGMWAVAKKDLLSIKRDTREWFGYLTPLLLMGFFLGRALFFPGDGAKEGLIAIMIMYTIMFSGNMALQSFGREGESEWLLNSVPLAGWPVVWGKLLAAALPTVILMELLLTGTALALGLPGRTVAALAIGAVLITLGGSAIGLYYSINNCRYNPDSPQQQRVTFGAALTMFLANGLLTGLLALCLFYTFPPAPWVAWAGQMPTIHPTFNLLDILLWLVYLLSRPLTWSALPRLLVGLTLTLGAWIAIFLAFMGATVRQARKGFQVRLTTGFKKTARIKV